ncbi:hypothetical protein [Escherichia coli]|nr:hypothetical protein [Escherichia coli]
MNEWFSAYAMARCGLQPCFDVSPGIISA